MALKRWVQYITGRLDFKGLLLRQHLHGFPFIL